MGNEATLEVANLRQEFGTHVGNSDQRHLSHEARIKSLENMEGKFDSFITRYDTNIAWLLKIGGIIGVLLAPQAYTIIKSLFTK